MSYVLYGPSTEVLQDREAALIEEIVASVLRTNRVRFEKHQHGLREAHAKSHGLLTGILTVSEGLPEHLRQGLFGVSRSYPVIARLSSAPGDIQSDRIPTSRGFAIKVLGVPGPHLLGEDVDPANQDWLLVNAPAIPFGDIGTYAKVQKLIESRADTSELLKLLTAKAAQGANRLLGIVGLKSETLGDLGPPNTHILGQTFHSMAAVRFGEYIAKISLAPASRRLRALTGQMIPADDQHPSLMRELVAEYFRTDDAEFEMRAQLCTDLDQMPVEDASIEWKEELSPHQVVARLTFPRQVSDSPARRVFGDDRLSFTPWQGMEAHQPLGSIMRVRKRVYEESSRFRHEANASPRVEPRSLTEIPD
jgi:hypothetical protein